MASQKVKIQRMWKSLKIDILTKLSLKIINSFEYRSDGNEGTNWNEWDLET